MRSLRTWVALVACIALPMTGRASVLVLEPWTTPFPPNPCLPASGHEVLFTGRYCDGVTCPPGSIVADCYEGIQASQTGVPAGGTILTRTTRLNGGSTPSLNARIDPDRHVLEFKCDGAEGEGNLTFTYDGGDKWNLSPAAMGATEIRMRVDGDMTPEHPLSCYILLEDVGETEESVEIQLTSTVVISGSGDVVIPFSSFVEANGFPFDLNNLDWIVIDFTGGHCEMGKECLLPHGPTHFTVGPVRFETAGPVASRRATWGQVKARYR